MLAQLPALGLNADSQCTLSTWVPTSLDVCSYEWVGISCDTYNPGGGGPQYRRVAGVSVTNCRSSNASSE